MDGRTDGRERRLFFFLSFLILLVGWGGVEREVREEEEGLVVCNFPLPFPFPLSLSLPTSNVHGRMNEFRKEPSGKRGC